MGGNSLNLTTGGNSGNQLSGRQLSESHQKSSSAIRVRAALVGPAGADASGADILGVSALQGAKAALDELEASRDAADARLGELIASWEEAGGTGTALICLRRASDNAHARLTWRRRGQAKAVIELDQLNIEEQRVTDMPFALKIEEERLVQNLRFSCIGYEIQRLTAFVRNWRKLQNLRRQFFPSRSRRSRGVD